VASVFNADVFLRCPHRVDASLEPAPTLLWVKDSYAQESVRYSTDTPIKIDDRQLHGLFDLAPAQFVELTGNEFGGDLNKLQLGKAADQYLKKLQHGSGLLNDDTEWLLKINKVGRKKWAITLTCRLSKSKLSRAWRL